MPMGMNEAPGMNDTDDVKAMLPKSICPGMDFKPGDEIVLRVTDVRGDMLEVEYMPEHSDDESHEMTPDEMENPPKDMKEMPHEKMRKKLPKAEREGY